MNTRTLREDFLQGMSRAAATVNVITTNGPAGRAGVTVSAMASVSADGPAPTLLVCVHHMSPTAQKIIDNGCFVVNILRDDQSFVSDSFAGRLPTADGDKFSCGDWVAMSSGAERVQDPLVGFDCKVQSSNRIGTHHVFIGEVQEVFVAASGSPLIFANRAYGAAEKIYPARPDNYRPEQALRIGALHTFGPFILPSMLKKIEEEKGPVAVDLFEGDQRRLLEWLRAGDIDLALLYDFDLGDDLLAETLLHQSPYVLLSPEHALAGKETLSLQDLVPYPAVLLDAPPSRDYFTSLFVQAGLSPDIAYRPWGLEMARGMVANGLGYCLLATKPASEISYDGNPLIARPLTDVVPPSPMVLVRRKGKLPEIAETFAWYCREAFGTDLN